jgi:hypothetical protein
MFHQVIPHFFPFDISGVLEARWARILSILIPSGLFALAWSRWKNTGLFSYDSMEAFLWSAVFSMGSLMFGPPSISYNSFSSASISMLLSLGMLCSKEENNTTRFIAGLLIGILTASLFYVKFSNAAAGIVIMILINLMQWNKEARLKSLTHSLWMIIAFVMGISFWCLIQFHDPASCIEQTGHYLNKIKNMAGTSSHHGLGGILERYRTDLEAKQEFLANHYLLPLGMSLILGFIAHAQPGKLLGLMKFILVMMMLKLVMSHCISENMIPEADRIHFFLLTGLAFMGFIILQFITERNMRNLILCFLPVMLMFLGSIGTSNAISTQFLVYLNLIGMFLFLSVKLSGREHNSATKLYFLPLFFGIALLLYDGYFKNPYRINGSLIEQNHVINSGPLTGIKVEKHLFELISSIRESRLLKTKLTEKPIVYCNSHEIGLVYALGGSLPSTAWNMPGNGLESKRLLMDSKRFPEALISSDLEPIAPEVLDYFRASGHAFPDSFVKVMKHPCHIAGFNREISFYVRNSFLRPSTSAQERNQTR